MASDDNGGGANSLIAGAALSAATDYLVVANGFDYADVATTRSPSPPPRRPSSAAGGQPWRALVKAKPRGSAGR